jgi:hypothetical protein
MIEDSVQPQDTNDSPPQLYGNKIRIAYIARPCTDGCSYKLLGSNNELGDSFREVELAEFVMDPLWVFPLDESDPTGVLPI